MSVLVRVYPRSSPPDQPDRKKPPTCAWSGASAPPPTWTPSDLRQFVGNDDGRERITSLQPTERTGSDSAAHSQQGLMVADGFHHPWRSRRHQSVLWATERQSDNRREDQSNERGSESERDSTHAKPPSFLGASFIRGPEAACSCSDVLAVLLRSSLHCGVMCAYAQTQSWPRGLRSSADHRWDP